MGNNSNLIFAFQTFSPNHENADQWFSPSLKKAFQICVDGAHFFLSTAFSRRRSHRMALRDARSRAKPFLHVFIGRDHPRWSSKTARAPSLNALRAVRLGGPSAARQRHRMGNQCYYLSPICTNSVRHPRTCVSPSVLLAHTIFPPIWKNTNKGAHLKTTRIKISNKHLTHLYRITNRQRRHKRAGNSLRHLQEGARSRKFRQRRDFARRKALW